MPAQVSGELMTWHKITLDFEGPNRTENAATFRDFRLNVTFRNEDTGDVVTVPGFFAADGDASETGAVSGNVWRVNFNPPSEGVWSYEASFRTGTDIAASLDATAGVATSFDGAAGEIAVAPTDKTGDDFRSKGMILQDEGTHFLQHQGDGDYFIRGGPGVPENFLATPDFDNTGSGRHDYNAHAGDFNAGDPTWSDGQGQNIVGAANYIAEQGLNTVYMLTNTIGGDGQDVGPWVDPDIYNVGKNKTSIEDAANDTSGLSAEAFSIYDVSKLAQWEILFDHMDAQGIYKNVLFQETENDQLLNGGTDAAGSSLSVERLVYMREMIARFGHNNGIQWNLGEENTNTDAERADMAAFVKAVDPYDHLVTIHTFPGDIDEVYQPLVGVEAFDGPSFQTGPNSIRSQTMAYRDASAAAGDPWVLAWDEHAGSNATIDFGENDPDSTNEKALRNGFWGHLTANGTGGNWYLKGNGFGGHSFDQNMDDFTGFTSLWTWTAAALDFWNTYVPFWEMTTNDGATLNTDDYVLAKDGAYYVSYLDYGAASDVRLDLSAQGGESFDVFWFDPRNGGSLIDGGQVDGGSVVQLGGAPNAPDKDWALFVRNSALPDVPPSAPPSNQPPVNQPPTTTPGDLMTTLQIIDAGSDQSVGALEDGGVIDLSLLTGGLSIAATPDASVGSVQFLLDGAVMQVENVAPYALFGDTNGDFAAGSIAPGAHTLSVRLFAGANASGELLGETTVGFEVAAGGAGNPTPPSDPPSQPPADPPHAAPEEGYYEAVANGSGARFKIQIEDAGTDPGGRWSFETAPDRQGNQSGFQGVGYYVYGEPNPPLARRGVVDEETFTYTIFVPEGEEGVYTFRVRVARDGNAESDKENDLWLNFGKAGANENIDEYLTNNGSNEAEPTSQGFVKVFGGPNNGDWGYATSYDGVPGNPRIQLAITEAGFYDVKIAGRSEGFHVDYFELYSGGAPSVGASNSPFVVPSPPAANDDDAVSDFNSDGADDILWRNAETGAVAIWAMDDGMVASTNVIRQVNGVWAIEGPGDFDGDGTSDVLWRNSDTGNLIVWEMKDGVRSSATSLENPGAEWSVEGAGDFDGDGTDDILWRNSQNDGVFTWRMQDGALASSQRLAPTVGEQWVVEGVGDFDGDAVDDILWRNTDNGRIATWTLDGGLKSSQLTGSAGAQWVVEGVGDFDNDGTDDVLWRNTDADAVFIWKMADGVVDSPSRLATIRDDWSVDAIGDYDGDQTDDILWRNDVTGLVAVWEMEDGARAASNVLQTVGPAAQIVSWDAEDPWA